jgi:hypothetical protein
MALEVGDGDQLETREMPRRDLILCSRSRSGSSAGLRVMLDSLLFH